MHRFKVPAHFNDLVNRISWGTPGPPYLPRPKVGGNKGNHRGLHIEPWPEATNPHYLVVIHDYPLNSNTGSINLYLEPTSLVIVVILTSPTDQVIWTTIPYRGGSATMLPLTSSSAPIKPY